MLKAMTGDCKFSANVHFYVRFETICWLRLLCM